MNKVRPISFTGGKSVIKFKRISPKVQSELASFEEYAKENNVELTFSRSINSKYLPKNDVYIVAAKTPSTKKNMFGYHGLGVIFADKNGEIPLPKFEEQVKKAVTTATAKLLKDEPKESKGIFYQFLGFLKKIVK